MEFRVTEQWTCVWKVGSYLCRLLLFSPLREFFGPLWGITDIGAFYLGKLCKELGESGEFYAMEGRPRQP